VLRPLLSVRWLERYESPAPIEFERLLHLISDDVGLRADIDDLLEKKRASPEMRLAAPVSRIHQFIERELERLDATAAEPSDAQGTMTILNELFRSVVADEA
jgi:uncharacterized protein